MPQSLDEFLQVLPLLWKHKLFAIAGIRIGLGNLLTALGLLFFSSRLSRMAANTLLKKVIIPIVPDKSSQNTYGTLAFYGCLVLFVCLSFTIAGIPLTVFTVLGGALAIGVGFGSQNIVNNFISGIILLVEKPIKVGDTIEIEAIAGKVLSIGTRSTKIRNAEGKVFVVPNSFLLEKSVLNWSYASTVIKASVKFGVAYGSDVKLVENVCMNILLNTEGVHQAPLPEVIFESFGESNLDFQVSFWCNTEEVDVGKLKSEIRFQINQKFKEHRLSMAYRTVDVRVLPNL